MSESSLSEDVTPSPLPPPGTRIIVTGAAQGIGRAVADAFHARGARVCAFDLGTVPDAPSSWIVARGNVSVPSDLEAAFARMEDEWGGVDVVHANAGISAGTGNGLYYSRAPTCPDDTRPTSKASGSVPSTPTMIPSAIHTPSQGSTAVPTGAHP